MESTRSVVVGVAGGIAAYKACHIIRAFKEKGDDVHVIPTPSALKFVGKATFEALSGNPVSTEVFDAVEQVRHVHLGADADLVVVAPATADFMARVAAGRADDLLSATILMATCPVVFAPAMHTQMWENPATIANVATLRSRGISVLEPADGRLTGKDSGAGRLPEPEQIVQLAEAVVHGVTLQPTLHGKKVVISAGGTRENIDPVRFIGNYSSGRQGFALAEIAAQRGAQVQIVAGMTEQLPLPSGAELIRVQSTQQMEKAINEHSYDADIVIMAAAVSDFRPESTAMAKLKKGMSDDALRRIELVENPDILKGLVERRQAQEQLGDQIIVGFAAETGDATHSALDLAKRKLMKKGCDFIVFNDVSGGNVFGRSDNQGFLLGARGDVTQIPLGTKLEVAARIFDKIEEALG
ncbi:bifunctional phosphopantothenoylcysteine decarboxylase/phosphopantothenate--cysteine ligase CoaBC [Corynebacterium sp. sy017]|uniref:bifunctional phosphopantothenoylcysteine decarboxylase/phosphopantothenate--cysteine ligase CoaBC n=1 Tax=unclassified Corynebacterium TaxID=2624378 RepID=UPI00118572C6|nr:MULTISPECIES: bifunctional phosphopantothenoylcysteine decarboxylase/phosphopantothenate--cysteine ligase CoaBC [unclassified Corynebacterium]MBP3087681.1 bifunctional phosphopantothenoylcysteine decarboxylase/phosphopantothenate--cysteine ligase CoaBC [Corynebacterium sp. sy017]TSD92241.1 bifunctional phosphopantothenoylcysteine decarboxylase/phosphopantothenate--cysteine ligase CoaBC [Corynebacterium sp. SY003]